MVPGSDDVDTAAEVVVVADNGGDCSKHSVYTRNCGSKFDESSFPGVSFQRGTVTSLKVCVVW